MTSSKQMRIVVIVVTVLKQQSTILTRSRLEKFRVLEMVLKRQIAESLLLKAAEDGDFITGCYGCCSSQKYITSLWRFGACAVCFSVKANKVQKQER